MKREITPELIREYEVVVQQQKLKRETIEKYLADVKKLEEYLSGEELTQEKLDAFPRWLLEDRKYKKRSVNAMVVSTRKFCQTVGWVDFVITGYTLDNRERKAKDKYISRGDYQKLVTTALHLKKYWLAMLIQTLCHMDIRYSELSNMTVEVVRQGQVEVTRRQKTFPVEIPDYLAKSLLKYAEQMGIVEGIIFQASTERMLDRSNAWREIKKLCKEAGLDAEQVNMQKFKMPLVVDYYPFYPMVEK